MKPSVQDRLEPAERVEVTFSGPQVTPADTLARPTFCPECATLGVRSLLGAAHFRRKDGTAIVEFGCSCGWVRVVEYQTR